MYERDGIDVFEVREHEDGSGDVWLEILPNVFVPVDERFQPIWERQRFAEPRELGLRLTAVGDQSGFRVTREELEKSINFLVFSLDMGDYDEFLTDDEWNLPKVLAYTTLRNARDFFGARLIDRYKWIDSVSHYIIEENRDSYRHVDFHGNLRRLREVNWLSAVVSASRSNHTRGPYRELTDYDYDNWGIDPISVRLARSLFVAQDEFDSFVRNQCGNSLVRDLVAAHLLFDDAVDPDGNAKYVGSHYWYHGDNQQAIDTSISRSSYRNQAYDHLNLGGQPDFWSIRRLIYLPDVCEELNRVRDGIPTFYTPQNAEQKLLFMIEILNSPTDEYDEFNSVEIELTDAFILFVHKFPQYFPEGRSDVSFMGDFRLQRASDRAQFVHDLVEYGYGGDSPARSVVPYPSLDRGAFDAFPDLGCKEYGMLLLAILGFFWRNSCEDSRYHFNRPWTGGFSEYDGFLKAAYGAVFDARATEE